MAQSVPADSPGTDMKVYVAEPAGEAKGGVIVIQEAFGITDHIKDVCHRLADAGYLAVAPHIFHRSGDPVIDYAKMQEVIPHIMQLDRPGIEADLKASFDHLERAGFTGRKVGIIGFCMGGTISFFAGHEQALGAAITFYGGGITMPRFGLPGLFEMAADLKTPWLGLYGNFDQSIPLTEVEVLKRQAAKAPVETDAFRYEADHGFHCNDRPAFFNEDASKDAWGRTIAFLDKHVAAA